MAFVKQYLLLQCFLSPTLISLLFMTAPVASTFPTSLPDCPDRCGDVTIPYPFGTRKGCYREGFNIACNDSFNPPKPFLFDFHSEIELLDINISTSEVRIFNYIGYHCYNESWEVNISNPWSGIQESPFFYSNQRNKFTVIGCYAMAYISGVQGKNTSYTSGCASFCDSLNRTTGDGGLCDGFGCCQTAIPEGLNYYEVKWGLNGSSTWSFNPCSYAALMEQDWYTFNVSDLGVGFDFIERNEDYAPVVLDWAIRENDTTCLASHVESSHDNQACKSNHSGCFNATNGEGYVCKCLQGYEGNPYLPDGCTDVDECKLLGLYTCNGTCRNTDGSYECFCQKGTRGDGKAGNCAKIPENFPYPARVAIASILGIAILAGICLLIVWYRQHRRHIKEKDEYTKYYEMMNTHLRVFSRKQIEIATNNFDDNYIIGIGGHGNVYKGLLDKNKPVAIKKSKEIDEYQKEEFVNEIILVSQINHKNIVKLYGCCLEVQIPMLVYEFVPNGTLFDLLHEKSRTKTISLGIRLKIALESAEALDYLHSTIAPSILHGDVKSANILLDDDYHAKVSDFGASNLLTIDDAQIVEIIQGTRGYLDPECLCTQIITKKSDVYSFGVVILEIITRKMAIYLDYETGIKRNLASCFVSKYNQTKLHEMLDNEIISNNATVIESLHRVSELAVWCLRFRGDDRPTMKQVVEELQNILRLGRSLPMWQMEPKETDRLLGKSKFYSASGSTSFPTSDYSAVLELENAAR